MHQYLFTVFWLTEVKHVVGLAWASHVTSAERMWCVSGKCDWKMSLNTGVQWNSETSASGVTLLAVTSEVGRQ